jgi:GAF domain-containing protein
MNVPVPADEAARLQILSRLGLLDHTPDAVFDDIARLAATICATPISLVSFVDADQQVFKARLGVSVRGTARCVSFCTHAICERELFVIPDTLADQRFRENPLVTGEPKIRFYAGMPILSDDGVALGTVCVADREPRTLDGVQETMLRSLAARAARHIATLGSALPSTDGPVAQYTSAYDGQSFKDIAIAAAMTGGA